MIGEVTPLLANSQQSLIPYDLRGDWRSYLRRLFPEWLQMRKNLARHSE
jgi:hypothetical protein